MNVSIADITGVVVTYNAKQLITRAYESVRSFHPDMKITVVDGSDLNDSCHTYTSELRKNKNNTVIHAGYNIGHGRGMCVGIYYATTPFVLLFDSDIEMLKSPVQDMLDLMEEDTFGVGYFERTGFDGFDFGAHSHHTSEESMIYLHPYFQLLQIKNYKKFHPYVHHGAPCYLTMLDIHKKGLSSKILKEFPGLGHSSGQGFTWKGEPREYIRHDTAGTRSLRKSHGLSEIEGSWEIKDSPFFNEKNRFLIPPEEVILKEVFA
jgi:glycosyltransferase involved in cell wall biosynthesis